MWFGEHKETWTVFGGKHPCFWADATLHQVHSLVSSAALVYSFIKVPETIHKLQNYMQ